MKTALEQTPMGISGIGVVNIREVNLEMAKEMIFDYAWKHDINYIGDIADHLNLDLEMAVRAIQELKDRGEIQEIET